MLFRTMILHESDGEATRSDMRDMSEFFLLTSILFGWMSGYFMGVIIASSFMIVDFFGQLLFNAKTPTKAVQWDEPTARQDFADAREQVLAEPLEIPMLQQVKRIRCRPFATSSM